MHPRVIRQINEMIPDCKRYGYDIEGTIKFIIMAFCPSELPPQNKRKILREMITKIWDDLPGVEK